MDQSIETTDPAARASPRGAFIVIEGLDRAGKSTQVQNLISAIRNTGRKVEGARFPDRTTTIGQMINQYLSNQAHIEDHVIHLLFSANRWELAAKIEQALDEGTTLVVDRYYYSGMIYSAAKELPSLPMDWAREPEVGLPRPDLVVFLDLEPEQAAARGGYGDERYEKKEMQEKVRTLFLGLKHLNDDEAEDMVVINAGGSIDEVHESILKITLEKLDLVEQGQLGNHVRRVGRWPSLRHSLRHKKRRESLKISESGSQ